jgi:hypothetical protein
MIRSLVLKHLISSVFALFLLSASIKTETVSQQCETMNPFIQSLANDGSVSIFDTPQPTSSDICTSELEPHGTCCDTDSLYNYHLSDTKKLATVAKAFAHVYLRLRTMLSPNGPIFESYSKRINQKLDPLIVKITSDVTHDKDRLANNIYKCWYLKLKETRSSSLCYTCSGRSSDFFKDDKAVITSSSCADVLSACAPSLEMILELVEGAPRMWKSLQDYLRYQAAQYKVSVHTNSKIVQTVNDLFEKFNAQEMNLLLEKYKNTLNETDSEEKNANDAELCSRFLDLNDSPFLVKFLSFMVPFSEAYTQLIPYFNDGILEIVKARITSEELKKKKFLDTFQGLSVADKHKHHDLYTASMDKVNKLIELLTSQLDQLTATIPPMKSKANGHLEQTLKILNEGIAVYQTSSRNLIFGSTTDHFSIKTAENLFRGDTVVLGFKSSMQSIVPLPNMINNWCAAKTDGNAQALNYMKFMQMP